MSYRSQGGRAASICTIVSAAVLLLALAIHQGIEWDLGRLVDSIGPNLFTISSREGAFDDSVLGSISTLQTIEAIGGSTAIGQFYSSAETLALYIVGVTSSYFEVRTLDLQVGRSFPEDSAASVAVLGSRVAKELFPLKDPIGQSLAYRGQSLEVIGVLNPSTKSLNTGSSWGFAQELDNPDNLVFLPHRTYRELVSLPIAGLEEIGLLGNFWVRARHGQLEEAMKQVEALFDENMKIQMLPLSSHLSGIFHTRRKVSKALTSIAFLILFVCTTNVASVLSTSVLSRRREIGVRRAIGAQRARIAAMFMVLAIKEIVVYGAVGAVLGVVSLGFVERIVGGTLRLGAIHILFLGALLVSGILAGVIPAIMGAFLDPVRAISQRSFSSQRLWGLSLNRVYNVFAILLGISAIIVITVLGDTNARYLELRWLAPEPGVLRVRPGIGGFRQPVELSYEDFEALASLDEVETAVWVASSRGRTVHSSQGAARVCLIEATVGVSEVGFGVVEEGAFPLDEEISSHKPVVVLGASVAKSLFPDTQALGKQIELDGTTADVVGILTHRPGVVPSDFLDINNAVIAPRGMMKLVNSPGRTWMWFKAKSDSSAPELSMMMSALIQERFPDRGLVEIIEPAKEMAELLSIQRTVTRAQLLLALLGSIVAAIGMGSTAWLSVHLKRHEIGVRKAIGAQNLSIFSHFLGESLLISIIGGVLGIVSGLGAAWFLTRGAEVRMVVNPTWLLIALGITCLVGVCSSFVPAAQAAWKDPITSIEGGLS